MPRDPSTSNSERLAFHVALVGALLPVISLPIVWLLCAVFARRAPRSGWVRGLLVVALLDTALAAGLLLAPERVRPTTRPAPTSVLGVSADPAVEGRLVLGEVREDSIALRAGLRVGDELLEGNGYGIWSLEHFAAAVWTARDRDSMPLRLVRGEQVVELEIPLEGVFSPEPTDLFEIQLEGLEGWGDTARDGLRSDWPIALGLLVVAAAARRRDPRPLGTGRVLALLLLALAAKCLGALPLVLLAGGTSMGIVLVADVGWSLVITLLAARLLARQPAAHAEDRGARSGDLPAILALGFVYLETLGRRRADDLVTLLCGATWLREVIRNPAADLMEASLGPSGRGLVVVTMVVVGPIMEEFLFRGVLLGWLRRWTRPTTAVLVSAVLFGLLHAHYGPGMFVIAVYGAVLGWARVTSGGLLAPVLLHMLLNGLLALLSRL